jgi:hypothetical protein
MSKRYISQDVVSALTEKALEQQTKFHNAAADEMTNIIKSNAYSSNLQKGREMQTILDWLHTTAVYECIHQALEKKSLKESDKEK